MGRELRSIVLTEGEFAYAAGLYFDAKPDLPVVSHNIASVQGPPEADGQGQVHLKDPLVDGQTVVTLEPQEMIDVVVAFCRDKAIPLPRNGRKSILCRDDTVVLEIELDWF